MTNDIRRARDVLAKWRENPAGMPWRLGDRSPWHSDEVVIADAADRGDVSGDYMNEDDARLIVGTAGNPDLLDAIDTLLALYEPYQRAGADVRPPVMAHAERIAAAIIAAERMNA